MTQSAEKADVTPDLKPALIVFGTDAQGRTLASWFTANDAPLAIKAANQRGLRYLDVTDDEKREAAIHVPQGQVFQSGRTMVPFVEADAYAKLLALAGEAPSKDKVSETGPAPRQGASVRRVRGRSNSSVTSNEPVSPPETPQPIEKPSEKGGSTRNLPVLIDVSPNPLPSPPSDWDEIQVGSLVLVRDHKFEAWYEAIVLKATGDVFRLKYRDYEEPAITRRRDQIALLYPADTRAAA